MSHATHVNITSHALGCVLADMAMKPGMEDVLRHHRAHQDTFWARVFGPLYSEARSGDPVMNMAPRQILRQTCGTMLPMTTQRVVEGIMAVMSDVFALQQAKVVAHSAGVEHGFDISFQIEGPVPSFIQRCQHHDQNMGWLLPAGRLVHVLATGHTGGSMGALRDLFSTPSSDHHETIRRRLQEAGFDQNSLCGGPDTWGRYLPAIEYSARLICDTYGMSLLGLHQDHEGVITHVRVRPNPRRDIEAQIAAASAVAGIPMPAPPTIPRSHLQLVPSEPSPGPM